jgi:hypothetical protein
MFDIFPSIFNFDYFLNSLGGVKFAPPPPPAPWCDIGTGFIAYTRGRQLVARGALCVARIQIFCFLLSLFYILSLKSLWLSTLYAQIK